MRTVIVDGLGEQFFSGSTFPGDQNTGISLSNFQGETFQTLQSRAFADDIMKSIMSVRTHNFVSQLLDIFCFSERD